MADEIFAEAMADIRFLLEPRKKAETVRVWPVLLAALAFAVCALVFAAAAILAPPVKLTSIAAAHAQRSAAESVY